MDLDGLSYQAARMKFCERAKGYMCRRQVGMMQLKVSYAPGIVLYMFYGVLRGGGVIGMMQVSCSCTAPLRGGNPPGSCTTRVMSGRLSDPPSLSKSKYTTTFVGILMRSNAI